MGVLNIKTDMGINGFDMSKASAVGRPIPIDDFSGGSVQIDWSGATSSDGFTSLGTFEFKVSNDGKLFFSLASPITITINAAAGSKLATLPAIPYAFAMLEWTKNNSTAGSAKASAIFKNHQ